MDDIGGQLTRSMLQGWELKRCGDTCDLGDFFAKSVLIRRKHHQSPSRNPWDPMGTWYILHLHLAT